jgi:threonyl-tRNA synthetase
MSLSENEKELEILRHSTSHVMAQAVKRLFPDVKVAIGPAIENGFYYDFDKAEPFTQEDLGLIEQEMAKIVKEDLPIVREEIPREEAVAMFREAGEAYKAELIEDMPEDEVVSLYRQGEFVDLCRGPHVESTGKIKAFKLLSVAGAYWHRNGLLQRLCKLHNLHGALAQGAIGPLGQPHDYKGHFFVSYYSTQLFYVLVFFSPFDH